MNILIDKQRFKIQYYIDYIDLKYEKRYEFYHELFLI
jgi:hypothetical protein